MFGKWLISCLKSYLIHSSTINLEHSLSGEMNFPFVSISIELLMNTDCLSGCYISFYHHLPIRASKVKNLMTTLARWHFYLPPKEKVFCVLYWKLYVHNTLLACPIWANVISWSFKMLARIWLLLAPCLCTCKVQRKIQGHLLPLRACTKY